MLRGCLIVFCVLFVVNRQSFGIMNHKHEREGIVTLTIDNLISVDECFHSGRVSSTIRSGGIHSRINWMELSYQMDY